MNLSDEDNTTFQLFDVNVTEQPHQPRQNERDALRMLGYVMVYVSLALGVPGNILSAIVWLRRHVISKNSSALYLAVLAISDLLFLIILILRIEAVRRGSWLYYCLTTVHLTTQILEPLLVLSFSIERLIAISCPLQVRCMCIIRLYDCVVNEFAVACYVCTFGWLSSSSMNPLKFMSIIVSYHWQKPTSYALCSKGMVGFASAANRQRLQALLQRSIRSGLYYMFPRNTYPYKTGRIYG